MNRIRRNTQTFPFLIGEKILEGIAYGSATRKCHTEKSAHKEFTHQNASISYNCYKNMRGREKRGWTWGHSDLKACPFLLMNVYFFLD